MSEEDIKVRAYYFYKDSFGNDANHRYYMAKDMTNRLKREECYEINHDFICRFCQSRYGSILTPYLPNNTIVCYQCYIMNSKDALISMYCNDTNNCNSHICEPMQDKTKYNGESIKSILKKDKRIMENIEEMIIKEIENERKYNSHQFTDVKKVHFNMLQNSYTAFSSY